MQAAGVRRYVGLATPAVADERDKPTLKAKVLRTMPRLAFPNALTEITGMTDAVRNSGLNWTIGPRIKVGPGQPTGEAGTGRPSARSPLLGCPPRI